MEVKRYVGLIFLYILLRARIIRYSFVMEIKRTFKHFKEGEIFDNKHCIFIRYKRADRDDKYLRDLLISQ